MELHHLTQSVKLFLRQPLDNPSPVPLKIPAVSLPAVPVRLQRVYYIAAIRSICQSLHLPVSALVPGQPILAAAAFQPRD